MHERISRALARMGRQSPHAADLSRRRFVAGAARLGLTAAAAAALTRPFAFPVMAQGEVALPEIAPIPERLKGGGVVRVCSYGGALQDAQRRAYFEPFERLSGIRVIESQGPDIAKIKAMVDTGNIEYDVFEEEGASIVNIMSKGDYLEPIDYSLFDVDNIDAVFRQPFHVDMLPYAQVVAYRTDAFDGRAPRDNKDLWDTGAFPGPRSLQGGGGLSPDLEVALMAAGTPPGDVYPIDLDRAFASLRAIKPEVVKWWSAGAIPAQLLSDDEVVMATAWNGRIAAAQAAGAPVEILWKDQLLRNDCWAVPKGAANAGNGQKFAAFITRAEAQARLSMLIPYGFVNNKAAELLPPERLKVLPTAPEIKKDLINYDSRWWAQNLDEVQRRFNAMLLG